jgi:acetyl esterase
MIDPQAKAANDLANKGPSLDNGGVTGMREWLASRSAPEPSDERLEIEDRDIAGVGVRVYRPAAGGSLPLVLFIHGGGWILGDLDISDHPCRQLALDADAVVVSVDYRLAPEAIYPAALEDCVGVLEEIVTDGAGVVGFDGGGICVAGESSGGHLAAATCLRAAEIGVPVDLQLLVCPAIDPAMDTPSWRELGEEFRPQASQMTRMWDLYAGSQESRETGPYLNLALERDLTALPETLILTAEYDTLRDEGERYGARLEKAGVPTEVRRIPGQVHSIFALARAVDRCREALHRTGEEVGSKLRHRTIAGKQN